MFASVDSEKEMDSLLLLSHFVASVAAAVGGKTQQAHIASHGGDRHGGTAEDEDHWRLRTTPPALREENGASVFSLSLSLSISLFLCR